MQYFDKFRLFGKYFSIAIDATGYASFEHCPYEGCPYRTSKKGKRTYLQPILEAKLVSSNMVQNMTSKTVN